MKIGLIDVDGHNFPNLPLMKISAWHKRRGDSVEWYDPLFSGHMELLQQLINSKASVNFNQGLDVRLLSEKNIELLKQIKLKCVHFAFDRWQDKDIIEPKLRLFAEKTGFYRNKVCVYILTNFDTTLDQDIYRIQLCRELNFAPYPMIYDKEHADPIYRKLQRWCNNRIFWQCPTFEEYRRKQT